MDEFVRAGDLGDDLAAKIDGIRHVLRSAAESRDGLIPPP